MGLAMERFRHALFEEVSRKEDQDQLDSEVRLVSLPASVRYAVYM